MTFTWENGDMVKQDLTYDDGRKSIEYWNYTDYVDNQNLWIYGLFLNQNITRDFIFLGRKSKHLLKSFDRVDIGDFSGNCKNTTYEYEFDSQERPVKIHEQITYSSGAIRNTTYELSYE